METTAQLNIRMPRDLKDRGDAVLASVGSSPSKIIRQLWEKLAAGGDEYERVAEALGEHPGHLAADEDRGARVRRSAQLFEGLGTSLGLELSRFEPDLRPEHEVMEEIEWDLLEERGLA